MITVRKALIAGATGAIGSVLLEILNDSDQYSEIHCIVRREPSISGEKIKAHIVSYDELDQLNLQQMGEIIGRDRMRLEFQLRRLQIN